MLSDEELARRLQAEENARADEEDARRATLEIAGRAAAAREARDQASNATSDVLVGTKLTYSCGDDKWNEEPVRLRVEEEPFQEGGMRLAYRARELFADGSSSDVVLKCFREDALEEGEIEAELIEAEAQTQMVAEDYAQQFNKLCASKGLRHCLAFVPVSVVRLRPEGDADPGAGEETYSIEPHLPGEYVKYSDNDGHTDVESDTAMAFSYFTHHVSGGALVITDIQGVGTFYTDPQIHTLDGRGFGAGNLGERGIRRFLQSHRHSLLCEQLGLPSQDAGLTDAELAAKIAADEERMALEEAEEEEARLAEEEALAASMGRMHT